MAASKFHLLLAFFFFTVLTVSSQAKHNPDRLKHVIYPENVNAPLTPSELNKIQEVYVGETDKILNNAQRLKDIKNILRNRVEVIHAPNKDLSSLNKLSEIGLFNNYNKSLMRDNNYNHETFNPLKYHFNFDSAIGNQTYRFNDLPYLIIVKSQNPQ